MTYIMRTASPACVEDAEQLRSWLERYAVTVQADVYHILPNGKRVHDSAMSRTIGQTTSAAAGAVAMLPAAPLLGLIPLLTGPFGLAISLGGLIADIGLLHKSNKKIPGHPEALYSEIELEPTNVSEKRSGWFEYLLAGYATRKGWSIKLTHSKAMAGYSGHEPTPWSEMTPSSRAKPKNDATAGQRKTSKLTGWW